MKHKFIKNRDIVMFSFQPWDTEIGSNFKDMTLELCKYNRVLFVNRALDRSYYYKHKDDPKVKTRLASIRKGIGELEEIQPNLWVQNPRVIMESINGLPFNTLHDWINKINNKRLARQINKAIQQLQFKDVILINDNDFVRGFYLKEMVECSHYIFYIRDYMLGVDFFMRHGPRHEHGLMRKADLVVANSAYLADYSRQFNPRSFDIGQGVDLSPFMANHFPKPADMENIASPIIGYAGNISALRIDPAIIQHIAERLPHCNVVLVGTADKEFESLRSFRNIHFLGNKPPHTVVNYFHHFDICINPQVVNEITIGNYPRKVDEYLAAGKPVVATATAAMKMFEPFVSLCSSKEEYVSKIKYITEHPDETNTASIQQQRKEFALSHTWENSIGLMGDAFYSVTQNMQHGTA
jgi:teichuronic acid biosynthesis glycosyltransferase TuaH